jgi:hypothetical protein
MNEETLRMQMISGIITEGEYKAKLQENKKPKNKKPLNENFVGIGAINNIFDREKSDYEIAFLHFIKGTSLNEEMEDKIEEGEEEEEVKEGNLYSGEEWSIEPEGRFWVVTYRTMDGKKEKVFQSEDEAREFTSTLDEGKEVEEPENY